MCFIFFLINFWAGFRGGVVVSLPDSVVNTWSRSSVWAVWAPDPDSVSPCEEALFLTVGKSSSSLCVCLSMCAVCLQLWLCYSWLHEQCKQIIQWHYQDFCSARLELQPISPSLNDFILAQAWMLVRPGFSPGGLLQSIEQLSLSGVMSNWANCSSTLCAISVSELKLLVLPRGGLCYTGLCVKWLLVQHIPWLSPGSLIWQVMPPVPILQTFPWFKRGWTNLKWQCDGILQLTLALYSDWLDFKKKVHTQKVFLLLRVCSFITLEI